MRESTDSGFRRVTLSSEGRAAEQARQILDEQMKHAYFQGQRGFNWARMFVCAIFLVRELVFMALFSEMWGRLPPFHGRGRARGVEWPRRSLATVKAPPLWFSFAGATIDMV